MNNNPPLSKEDHPQNLSPHGRKEWHLLCDRLFELYDSMPLGKTERKIIAGCDEENGKNCLVFFRGNLKDLLKIKEMLG